ncbi:MAG: acid--CoA ligase [Rhodospirillaceae bacterium]|uniref:class I adenylate-forming enzyme family protein n=1 Tax=Hwanghaeella sp. 1Z406 TaxID=3402811 RepID=UPI000C4C41CA|nr:acid--CoA ligase [Rhodospirillales bacterium]MAX49067.1 acid--CoA ligase [Rhodospirillaceae bacterium]
MAARNGRPVTDDVIRTGSLSVYELFAAQVARNPNGVAISQLNETWTYSVLQDRVRRTAALLRGLGIMPGQRIALMAENRHEYAEIELAAAMIGAIVACQNWRLADDELRHCINLVSPSLVIVSERYQEAINRLDTGLVTCLTLGDAYEQASRQVEPLANSGNVDPEDGLVILYTSGTTGLPKGALISHRAEIARMAVLRMDLNVTREDGFVAWAPMFHMGSTDQVLGALMSGATVHIVDGFNADRIVDIMEQHAIGWMLLMPGSIEPVVEILEKSGRCAKSIRAVGAMIDLVPLSLAAKLSRLTNAPYLNSFGATETGLAPASAMLIPPGEMPETLSKIQSSLCDVRLLDPDGHDVPYGTPGEVAVRGPTVFSGYWNADDVNRRDFQGGWFRMGDLFQRSVNGGFDFVDRAKYMIKSGGENIYPAEIERVLLSDKRIREAVVIRRKDAHWGEIPIACIARADKELTEADVDSLCRGALAGYKRPRGVYFMSYDAFPRSTTGKILRHEIEVMVQMGQIHE